MFFCSCVLKYTSKKLWLFSCPKLNYTLFELPVVAENLVSVWVTLTAFFPQDCVCNLRSKY